MKFDNPQYILERLSEELNESKFSEWVEHINYFKKYSVTEEIDVTGTLPILRLKRTIAPEDEHVLILGDIQQMYNSLFALTQEQVDIEEYLKTGRWTEKDWSSIILKENLCDEKYGNKYAWLNYIYESEENIILMPFGIGKNKFEDSLDVYGGEIDIQPFEELFIKYEDYDIYLQKTKRILYKIPEVRNRLLRGELLYMPYLFGPELIFHPFI